MARDTNAPAPRPRRVTQRMRMRVRKYKKRRLGAYGGIIQKSSIVAKIFQLLEGKYNNGRKTKGFWHDS